MLTVQVGNHTFILPGREVICDMCSKDWTDDPTPGGFLLLSNGVCPDCEDRVMKSVKKYNEEWSIKAYCPSDMAYADWIRDIVRTGKYKTQ